MEGFKEFIEQKLKDDEDTVTGYSNQLMHRHLNALDESKQVTVINDAIAFKTMINHLVSSSSLDAKQIHDTTATIKAATLHSAYWDKDLIEESSKLTLEELREQALELGYSLQKIEYESTDLTGTNKIKLKG